MTPFASREKNKREGRIGPLHDLVTWCKITHAEYKLPSWTSKTKAAQGGLLQVAVFWESHCVTCIPALCDFV